MIKNSRSMLDSERVMAAQLLNEFGEFLRQLDMQIGLIIARAVNIRWPNVPDADKGQEIVCYRDILLNANA